MDGVNDTGRTRIERNNALRRNFEAHGITVRQDIVPNVPHDGLKVLPAVEEFFADVLREATQRTASTRVPVQQTPPAGA